MRGRPRLYASKIQVALQPSVLKALRSLAKLRGCTLSELIREACRQYTLNQIQEIKDAQKMAENVPSAVAEAVHRARTENTEETSNG